MEESNREQFDQFNLGGPTNLVGSEMQIPRSVKSLKSIGPNAIDNANVGMEGKMLMDLTPEQQQDLINQMLLLGNMGEYHTSSIEAFSRKVEKLSMGEGDVEKIRKEIESSYKESLLQALYVNEQLFDKVIDSEHNAYPFLNGPGDHFFSYANTQLSEMKEAGWMKEGSESWVWVKRLERDLKWTGSFFQNAVAYSASLPAKYDIIVQLQTLKQQREGLPTEVLEAVGYGKLSGLEFDEVAQKDQMSEKQWIKAKTIGIKISDEYLDYNFPEELTEGVVGIRELAIKFQDECDFWRMKIAAVSQLPVCPIDEITPKQNDATFMGKNLKEEEIRLITELLKEYKSNPSGTESYKILNPFSADSDLHTQRKISATIQALLRTNAHDRLQKIGPNGDIGNLVKDVVTVSDSIQNNWLRTKKGDWVARVAKLVTRMGYLEDFYTLVAHDYCWSFSFERKSGGNWEISNKLEIGGIDGPSGDAWSLNWARRKHQYDQQGNSSASELLPTDKKGREEVSKLPLNEMPRYRDDYRDKPEDLKELEGHPDEYLIRQWRLLFSDDPSWKAEREKLGYKEIPANVKNKLMQWAFRWKTCYNARDVGDGDYLIEVPHFLPADLPVANMWNTVTTEKDKKVTFGAETIWQQRIRGVKRSEISLENVNQQEVARWLVDCEMASRYMRIFIEVVDSKNDALLGMLSGNPGTMALKELAKRIRLSLRDSPEASPTLHEISIIPWLVTLITANKYNISSPKAWNYNPEDKAVNRYLVDRFREEMASWKKMMKWLPSDRPKIDKQDYYEGLDYGNAMAQIAEFYESILLRMGKASAEDSYARSQENYDLSTKRISGELFWKSGKLKHSPPKDVSIN